VHPKGLAAAQEIAIVRDKRGNQTMRWSKALAFRGRSLLVTALLSMTCAIAAAADEWTEQPYNPPPGSRWIVQSESDEVSNLPDGTQTIQTKSRAELTIEAITATGFRISYVHRDTTVDGNAPAVAIMRPIVGVLKDTVIRGTTDSAGKPTNVDNIDEVKASMRAFIDSALKAFDSQPKLVAILRPIFASKLNADGPAVILHDLYALSAGQSTGLKLGEERHESSEIANPLGGAPVKVATTLRIEQADPQNGHVTFVRDSQMDPEGIKEFTLDMMRKFGGATGKPVAPSAAEAIKAVKLTIDGRTTINVEDGMTRMLREESTNTFTFMGRTLINTKVETITVTQAP
jgi:hypothetical protein